MDQRSRDEYQSKEDSRENLRDKDRVSCVPFFAKRYRYLAKFNH